MTSIDTHPLSRYAQIARLLLKYRHANLFDGAGWNEPALLQAAGSRAVPPGEPEQLAHDLEALGPTFIKIGQALSTRPDLVPAPYATALERMQDAVAAFDSDEARAIIEADLGIRINQAFAAFDDQPLAAASLAQVHAARLHSGREVVVKVQRPRLAEAMAADLDALARLAAMAESLSPMSRQMGISAWVAQLRETMLAELDYRQEAENLEILGRYVAPYPALLVPAPVLEFSGARVLTMDRVHGQKVTRIAHLRTLDTPLAPVASALVAAYLDQVFVYGLIHADPHPGNVLLTPDNRLGIIDLGMVTYVGPRLRDTLLQLLLAAVDGRGEDVATVFLDIGIVLEESDPAGFERQVTRLVARYSAPKALRSLSEGRLLLELTRLAALHGIRPPPALSVLGKTLLNLEAVCVALDPHQDVRSVVESHLQRMLQKRLLRVGSMTNAAAVAIDTQALVRDLPRMALSSLKILSENRLRMHIAGLEEAHLIQSMQKIANRITAGVVAAALLLGGALALPHDAGPSWFGYPPIALVFFVAGFSIAAAILLASFRDRGNPDRGSRRR